MMRSHVNSSHAPRLASTSDSSDPESDTFPATVRPYSSARPSASVQTPGQRDILDHTPLFRPTKRMDRDKEQVETRYRDHEAESSRRWTIGEVGEGNAEAGPSRLGGARLPESIHAIRRIPRQTRRSLPSHHADHRSSRSEKRRRTMMAMTVTTGLNSVEPIDITLVSDDDNDDYIEFLPNPPTQARRGELERSPPSPLISNIGEGITVNHLDRQSGRADSPDAPIPPVTLAVVDKAVALPRTRTPSANDASQASAIIPSASPVNTLTPGPSRTSSTSQLLSTPRAPSTSNRPLALAQKSYVVIPTKDREAVINLTKPRQSRVNLITPTPSPPPPIQHSPRPPRSLHSSIAQDVIVIEDSDGDPFEDDDDVDDQRAMHRHIRQLEEKIRVEGEKKKKQEEMETQQAQDKDQGIRTNALSAAPVGQSGSTSAPVVALVPDVGKDPVQRRSSTEALAIRSTVGNEDAAPRKVEYRLDREEAGAEELRASEGRSEQERRDPHDGAPPTSDETALVVRAAGDMGIPVSPMIRSEQLRSDLLDNGQRTDQPDESRRASVDVEVAVTPVTEQPGSELKSTEMVAPTQHDQAIRYLERQNAEALQVARKKHQADLRQAAEAVKKVAEGERKRKELERGQMESRRIAEEENPQQERVSSAADAAGEKQRREETQRQIASVLQAVEVRRRDQAAKIRRDAEAKAQVKQAQAERVEAAMIARKKKEEEEQAALAKRKQEEEQKRQEAAREEKERLEAEKRRVVMEREDLDRLERERIEKERQEREAQDRIERERAELERLGCLELERAEEEERQKREDEERLKRERLEAEQARLMSEQKEKERQEQARLDQERLDKQRQNEVRLDRERLEQERLDRQPRLDTITRNQSSQEPLSMALIGGRDESNEIVATAQNGGNDHQDARRPASAVPEANHTDTAQKQAQLQRIKEMRKTIRITEAKKQAKGLQDRQVAKSDHAQRALMDLVARAKAKKAAEDAKKAENDRRVRDVAALADKEMSGGEKKEAESRLVKRKLPDEREMTGAEDGLNALPVPEKRIRTDVGAAAIAAKVSVKVTTTTVQSPSVTARRPFAVRPNPNSISPSQADSHGAGNDSPQRSESASLLSRPDSHSPSTAINLATPSGNPTSSHSIPPTSAMTPNGDFSIPITPTKPRSEIVLKGGSKIMWTHLFPGLDPAKDPKPRLDRMARFLDTLGEKKAIAKRSGAAKVAVEVTPAVQAPPTPPEIEVDQSDPIDKTNEARTPAADVEMEPVSANRHELPTPGSGGPIEQSDLLRKYGLPCPISRGRINNKYTTFSSAIVPGTLKDLMWELDLLYDGSVRGRQDMRWQEEDKIWDNMRNVSDKRRFLLCCWNRWSKEKGPIRADQPSHHLRGWMDKYGEIMRFGGLNQEVRDHFSVLLASNIIGLKTFTNANLYWDRHMRHYRKIRECPDPLDEDFSDTEQYVTRGVIRLKEFEPGGRHHEEVSERKRAREEGRRPILPKEKYVLE